MLKRTLPSRAQRLAGASAVTLVAAGVAAAAWAAQPTRVVATVAAPVAALTHDSDHELAGGERHHERRVIRGHDRELTPEERAELEAAMERVHAALDGMEVDLEAAHAAMAEIDHEAIAEAVAEAMESAQEVRLEHLETLRELEGDLAPMHTDHARRAEIRAEVREAIRQARIELEREAPRINAEVAAAVAESMREARLEMAREMPRIRAEVQAALREAEVEITRERDEARARGDDEEAADLDRALRDLRRERERRDRSDRH